MGAFNKKFRPAKFEELLGQQKAVRHMRRLLQLEAHKIPHAYLLVGPSGVGKTSAARILARRLNCESHSIQELDAATNASIDQIRDILVRSHYKPAGGGNRALIIDEAQQLSKPIWSALLKSIEEPPDHFFWILCSTEELKLPETLRTRPQIISFRKIPSGIIERRLRAISKQEKSLASLPEESFQWMAQKANGSMRKGYNLLEGAQGISTLEELTEYLDEESETTIRHLLRQIVEYPSVRQQNAVLHMLAEMKDYHPEIIRQAICNYLTFLTLHDRTGDYSHLPSLLAEFAGKEFKDGEGMASILMGLLNYWKLSQDVPKSL